MTENTFQIVVVVGLGLAVLLLGAIGRQLETIGKLLNDRFGADKHDGA